MKNLPNKITYSRFFFGILMILSVFIQDKLFFVIFYILALLTDILDGFFARKLKKTTKIGKKLDILADNFILLCALIGLYFFQKQTLIRLIPYFIGIFFYYLLIQVIAYLKTKKPIFMRTYAANLTAVAFPFIVFFILFFKSKSAVIIYAILMVYSLTEKLFLQISKSKYTIFSLTLKKIILFFIIFVGVSTIFLLYRQSKSVCFENKCIEVEVMDTPNKRSLGLMYRPRLQEDKGMLFVFDYPLKTSFWMKNMQFSIDMIFIRENKTIAHIEKDVPPCYNDHCPTYPSIERIKYVVEVNAGFSDNYGLSLNQDVYID